MEFKKFVVRKAAILPIVFCLFISGCAAGGTENIPYSEASCQVLMHHSDHSGYDMEDMKIVGEE